MKIKSKINLKCSRCGGVKYIDDPYNLSSTWFADISCLTCGDIRSIEVDKLKILLSKLEGAKPIADR